MMNYGCQHQIPRALLRSPESFLWSEQDRRNQYVVTDMYITGMLADGNVSL